VAITEVGSGSQRAATGNNSGVDSASLAFPGNVTSGSLLIVAGAMWASGAAPTGATVTDTRSTSYTVVVGTVPPGMTWRTFLAYGVAPSGGACTVTVNPTGSSADLSFSIDEFAGQDASPADVDGGTSTGLSSTSSDSLTTVAADALIVGVTSHEGSTGAITPTGTGQTQIGENESNSANQCHNACFRIVTTATSYTFSWTLLSTHDWAAQTHSFKPSTGAAPVSFPPIPPGPRRALLVR